jgi:putative N6-adenine-specific DNA methylase
MEDARRACLWSRVAVRVLLLLATFDAPDDDALYEGVRGGDWSAFVSPKRTLAVKATCRSSVLTHSQFIAQKTKDAIVDQLRDRAGARPSVDLEDPDVVVIVRLVRDKASVYVDLAGRPLHERGWRAAAGEAPLKETLAAAVVRLAGWDRARPLVDPMCGAGTIAIEAAAWARAMAPGLGRARFGFERWASFDEASALAFRALREEARSQARSFRDVPRVTASDVDARMVDVARANARKAGVAIDFAVRDVRDLAPTDPPGFVVTNPPYGARLDADRALWRDMARAFARMRGHTIALLAGTPEIARAMRGEPTRWLALYNGAIECRLLVYELEPA